MAATPSLYAPWRMQYIKTLEAKSQPASPTGCFLCDDVAMFDDPAERRARLILWKSEQSIVVINKFPYTSGHLLVAPIRHVDEPELLSDAELLDLEKQTIRATRLLKKVLNPQGFNIGENLGRAAGAGLPGHLHRHVVPRWNGDTNFMSVIGDSRIIPQSWDKLWSDLVAAM
jgi:ATP adenylyltransferase